MFINLKQHEFHLETLANFKYNPRLVISAAESLRCLSETVLCVVISLGTLSSE